MEARWPLPRARVALVAAVVLWSASRAQAPAADPTRATDPAAGEAGAESAPVGSGDAKPPCRCSDPETRARLARCFPHLLVHDAGRVFTAPARWKKKEWGLFATGLVGVGTLVAADDDLRTAILRGHDGIGDTIARVFEPLGMQGSFVVIGGFLAAGFAAHDEKAKGVGLDALAASLISGGVITPVIKEIAGRSRPREGQGPYRFEPFHGGPSFPSGHATQAFAVASVIATEYPERWVRVACYVPASLVLYARMRHDAHWASDVTAGALIGYGVGHGIARLNLARRVGATGVQIAPRFARGASGALLTVRF